ncbi:hypothetical protein BKI52_16015 [marine bacterium AO1-C]|nr:hypothetical protein BKI52_16015 [marine bacterium AO1-C]
MIDLSSSGTTSKLKLTSFYYKGTSFSEGEEFEAMINPSNISNKVGIQYNPLQVPGSIKPHLQFVSIDNETYDFNLILDGTGLIDPDADSVEDQLEKFRKITYGYNSSEHEATYVKISWGNINAPCRLTSLTVKYTLFDSEGKALRAELTCSFKETTLTDEEEKIMNKNSPDMTHVKVVKAGYGLRHMCYEIYGDNKLDVAIARFNGFTSRYVPLGTEVILPPLKTL